MEEAQLYKYNPSFYAKRSDLPQQLSHDFFANELSPDHVSWLNYHGLSDHEAIEWLCHTLSIDKISIEQLFLAVRRSKIEEYPGYLFFQIKSVLPDPLNRETLHQDQLSFILGQHFIVSFQDKASDHFTDVRQRIEQARGKIRSKQADFLLFRLLEAIIDNYFEVLEDINNVSNVLDVRVHDEATKRILHDIEIEKRRLMHLRQIAQPMRDIVLALENSDSQLLDKSNHHYFKNLRNSCTSILEEIDTQKQILDGMANLYYAAQGQRMNEIMKVLTVVSSIFIPLTFIVGVYGMNFKYMPELNYPNGYYTVVALMFVIGAGLLTYFIRRGWLKKGD
ncbi:MAG: magnesium and cobalt transport protein CorA [Bacteroidota bacterium]